MAQPEPYEQEDTAVADYKQQARDFLGQSRVYLAEGNLHQASEKGWGAAAHMAKAVATAKGWEYIKHIQFSHVLNEARRLTGDSRIPGLRGIANELHGHYYERKRNLEAESIGVDLDNIADLLDILKPLTEKSRACPCCFAGVGQRGEGGR